MHIFLRKLLLSSALTFTPFLSLAAPLCAVQPASTEPRPAPSASAVVTYAAGNEAFGLPTVPASETDLVPALRQIRASGAQLYHLAEIHGLRSVFAVAGDSFQVFYLSPDGEVAIRGIAQDATGKNLTRDQIARVPGVIPTAVLGGEPHTASAAAFGTEPAALHASAPSPLQAVQATASGIVGRDEAPRIWMFIDPQCSFSQRAMQQLYPLVVSGRVQVAVIPVSLLDHEDQGLSTIRAEAMLSLPPEQMAAAWIGNRLSSEQADIASITKLTGNMLAADQIRLLGTPTFIWRKADGSEGRADGIPADLNAMIASAVPAR